MDDFIKFQLDSKIIELQFHYSSSIAIAVELHFKYRKDGFTPDEFYSYITGFHPINKIDNWSDAVMKLASFFEEKQASYAIH